VSLCLFSITTHLWGCPRWISSYF